MSERLADRSGWWIKHDGVGMPVPADQLVRVRYYDGWESRHASKAESFKQPVDRWWKDGRYDYIVAYQICGPNLTPAGRAALSREEGR